MHEEHVAYMRRCIRLAQLGAGNVAPNPMVGAVLVYDDRIIGEGYHEEYGRPHAEVNCITSVKDGDKKLIQGSTLYVSLEPCTHFGKTPPCSDLIIQKKIPKVVIGCSDPFPKVNGKGVQKLRHAGVEVLEGILENECKELNKRFFKFHTGHQPYIILKWAQTSDCKIANNADKRLKISSEVTNKLVHKWRSEEAAILIGTNTAQRDDPQLTNRLWTGKNPIRLVIDLELRLPGSLKIFSADAPTVIFNLKQNSIEFSDDLRHEPNYYQVTSDVSVVHQVLNACYTLGIQSILVEGGAQLLQSFIDEDVWDEARIITNQSLFIGNGLSAPDLGNAKPIKTEYIHNDRIDYFRKQVQDFL